MLIHELREYGELAQRAAAWFHSKWKIPLEAYRKSINECINGGKSVPQWYIVLDGDKIIGGIVVIENDFHNRKELTPNVCAVFVEEAYRSRGIAGEMLRFVSADMAAYGIDTLYLVTEHTGFYERYGWQFLCMVQGMASRPFRGCIYIKRLIINAV